MDPRILEESGEEEPILNVISYIMMMKIKFCEIMQAAMGLSCGSDV
jgi:hypothetical protein